MSRNRSDIFDEFIKIAQEKGMLSNDSNNFKKKLENSGRAGSDDISTIEALYGVKSNIPKNMNYKSNIMESAHAKSVVVSPSYDKLNGLVENNIERQNILLNIVNKPVNGHLTQHKYAEKELILSLVRLGNDLDHSDNEKLRILADNCLLQISTPKLKKQAVGWTPFLVGGAALLGGLWLQQHLRMVSDGLDKDHEKLIGEIDDILKSSTNWGIIGNKYKSTFVSDMQDFKNKIQDYYNKYKKAELIINDIEKIRDLKDLKKRVLESSTDKIQQTINDLKDVTENIFPAIKKIIENFNNEGYKQRQTQEKGFFTSLIDKTQIFHGGKGLIADDFDDVRRALETYLIDIEDIFKIINSIPDLQDHFKREMQSALTKSRSIIDNKPSSSSLSPSQDKTKIEQMVEEGKKLLKDNLGIGRG